MTLSSTSTVLEYNGFARLILRSKIFGRAWLPISSRSLKPLVIIRACFWPFRSRRAFVATVVDSRTYSMIAISKNGNAFIAHDCLTKFVNRQRFTSLNTLACHLFEDAANTFCGGVFIIWRILRQELEYELFTGFAVIGSWDRCMYVGEGPTLFGPPNRYSECSATGVDNNARLEELTRSIEMRMLWSGMLRDMLCLYIWMGGQWFRKWWLLYFMGRRDKWNLETGWRLHALGNRLLKVVAMPGTRQLITWGRFRPAWTIASMTFNTSMSPCSAFS